MNSSVYDSFNARNLAPPLVARTFVPGEHFERVSRRTNSLVIGPRGSGKTTLLKMLQPDALAAWAHPSAEVHRAKIDYTGVFIGTDISWSSSPLEGAVEVADWEDLLSKATFTAHLLRAVVRACRKSIVDRKWQGESPLDEVQLIELAIYLRKAWRLAPGLNSLRSIDNDLTERLSELGEIKNLLLRKPNGQMSLLEQKVPYIDLDYLQSTILAITAFDNLRGLDDHRWALCFDELEIAPQKIVASLFSAFRSTDQKLLLKLAVAPFSEATFEQGTYGPARGHDYEEVQLWSVHKEDNKAFCRSLWTRIMHEKGFTKCDEADEFLGQSAFDTDRDEYGPGKSAYRRGTKIHKHFVSLSIKDPAFGKYLRKRKIDVGTLEVSGDAERASELRKIASLVIIRDTYLKSEGADSVVLRSRKSHEVYTGASGIYAISEGNPRWLIGLANSMTTQLSTSVRSIPRPLQSQAVQEATAYFRMRLKLIPSGSHTSTGRSALRLIDSIGQALQSRVLDRDNFFPEHIGCFTVDSHLEAEDRSLLGAALNAGAIIYVPDSESLGSLASLVGKTFRLSYMLTPHFRLPLLKGQTLSLSKLLGSTQELANSSLFEDQGQ